MIDRGLARTTLLLTLALVACGSAHGDKTFDRGTGFVPPRAKPPLVRLARAGACPRWCPTYSVDVDVDGGVTYTGGSNVMTVGPAAGHLTPDELRQLRAVMGKASQAKMPTQQCACGCVTNTPVVYLTTWDKIIPRTVMYDEGCEQAPHAIRVLEDAVDDLVGIERWIGTLQQRRLCFEEQRDCSALVGAPRQP